MPKATKKQTGSMTAKELADAEKASGMTQKAFAEALGITARSLQLYKKGAEIPKKIALSVRYLLTK